MVAQLWEIALGIEDGNLSLAADRLREARENLSEAIENGASDEEIERLMSELRAAMQEFMQAVQENMQNVNPNQEFAQNENAQTLRQQDLERMMDQIEELISSFDFSEFACKGGSRGDGVLFFRENLVSMNALLVIVHQRCLLLSAFLKSLFCYVVLNLPTFAKIMD